MLHGFFDGRVIDWLFVNRSISPPILLLLCLDCALSLARRNHCLLATIFFIKFCGGRGSLIFMSALPFLYVAVGWLYVADRVLRCLLLQIQWKVAVHQINIDIDRGSWHVESHV